MPAALPIVAGAFLAVGATATALGVTLGVAFTIGSIAVTWAAVATITGVALLAVSALTMKIPKPDSSGQQISTKLDPKSPVPVAYGRTATGGYVGYRQAYGSKNKFLALAAILSVGPILSIDAYAASNDTLAFVGDPHTGLRTTPGVPNSKLYKNKLRMRYQHGETPAPLTMTQAAGNEPLPGNPGKLSGIAHAIGVFEYDTDNFPNGLPASLWTLRGLKLYDPRKDSTYPGGSGAHRLNNHQTWEFSENPFLAALDWTLGRWYNSRKVYGIGARWGEVDVAAFVAGANVADANGWKVGGVVTSSDDKFAVLATILQAGGGLPIARGAQISCSVNAPKTSTFTISSADIIGEIEGQNSTSWRDRQNSVIPTYRAESQNWELIAGEEVSQAAWITEDGGEKKTSEVEFPLVQQAAQAHQLATYELCNSREFLTFNMTCRLRLLNVRVGDAVTVNIPEIGANGQKCLVMSRDFNPGDLSVNVALKSETDSKHPFALGQSQVAPAAPALSGYDPGNPGAPEPSAWSIVATEITKDGVTLPAIVIGGETDDPNAQSVVVEYRPQGSSAWFGAGVFDRSTRIIEITAVTAGTSYEVALSYRTVRGVLGERLILTSVAGPYSIDWSAGVVTGPTRPADNATVGAPVGTDVAGTPAEDLVNLANEAKNVADGADTKAQAAINAANQLAIDAAAAEAQIEDLLTTYGSTASAAASASAAAAHEANADRAQTNAEAARDQAVGAESAAADILVDAESAKDAATAAKTASETARSQAQTFASNASGSATAAAGSASTASTHSTNAGNSASAASASATAATTKANDAAGSATAAGTSATAAATSATNAGTSATSASTSANTATTKAGEATTKATQAATSATNAAGSASTATTQATNAANSATGAGNSATAANTSAGNAATSATNAGNSATSASTNAVSAQSSFNALKGTIYNNVALFPSDFAEGVIHWTGQRAGDPTTVPDIVGTVGSDADFGTALTFSPTIAGANIMTKGAIAIGPGRKYEITARFKASGGDASYSFNLITSAMKADYTAASTAFYTTAGQTVAANVVTTLTAIFSMDTGFGSTAVASDVAVARFGLRLNSNETGMALVVDSITINDVTEREEAAASASAAATSASTATTKAGEASTSASSANTSATTANTRAGAASTSATQAATSATNASGSATTASTHATNSANSAGAAAGSATAASTSASTASTKATEAGNSASSASSSANTAGTKATESGNSATAAASSASAASTSAGNASTSATSASTSANTASTQASNASTSASAASGSAATASSAASAASSSATLTATYSTGGGNALTNTDLAIDTSGWTFVATSQTATGTRNAAGDDWRIAGENNIGTYQDNATATGYSEWRQIVSVLAGKWYDVSALVAAHRCQVVVYFQWVNAAGSSMTAPNSGTLTPGAGGDLLSGWTQIGFKAQAPVGAVAGRILLRKLPTLSGQTNSYAWFGRPQIRETFATAPTPCLYSPGSAAATATTMQASISENATALATANSSLASLTSTVTAQGVTVTNTSSALATTNGNVTTLFGKYGTTINANGYISGWSLNNNGVAGSAIFDVDSFAVGKNVSGANRVDFPFQIVGTTTYIKSAMIQDAAITNAKIGNLQVDTIKIAGNAVTIPVSAFAAHSDNTSNAWQTFLSAGIDAEGYPVQVTVTATINTTNSGSNGITYVRVLRDGGVEVYPQVNYGSNGGFKTFCVSITDNPGGGAHTYQLQIMGGTSAFARAINLLAVKR